MVSKTKHRNTARKRRHTLRRKKQRGGQTDAERHAELTRLWRVCEGDRDRAEAKVVELNAKVVELNAKVVELNAKVAQLVSENNPLVKEREHMWSPPTRSDSLGNESDYDAETDDGEELHVVKFDYGGKSYLKTGDNMLYNPADSECVGRWNPLTKKIDKIDLFGSDEESDDDMERDAE